VRRVEREVDLDSVLDGHRRAVDAALERAVALPDAPERVADPIRYAVRGGGKRIRPVLCVAAYGAFRPEPPAPVYDLAAALELIHTYSLVHDDLPSMDDDDVRRGRPATHVAYDVPRATVAGAALIPLAVRVAGAACQELELGARERGEILGALCAAAGAGGMVGGQVLDLEAEGRDRDLGEIEEIHRRKTGALLAVAPRIGGAAARVGELERDALQVYGVALGLAFQIADDILDVTATTAILGKTAGRDRDLAKATYPAVAGVDAARARARQEVETALAALDAAGIRSGELVALAHFVAERDR
jgi:geranylgeranyl diphosphate synthase, type II